MDPCEISLLSNEEKKARFRQTTITKSAEESAQDGEARPNASSTVENETTVKQGETEGAVSSKQPKRRRSVGEPAPKRYAVGEPETSHTP